MKKVFLIGLTVLLLGLLGSLVFAEYDYKLGSEPDGFRGIKWGTDISTLKDMEYLFTDPSYGGIEVYRKKNDNLRIGGVRLKTIIYGFWEYG